MTPVDDLRRSKQSVFVVYTTGWDPEVDSVWDNIESAKARADEINPARDWGIIERRDMNSTEQEQVDRQEQPGEEG